jgi:preprotein translocase subunit YajC
MYGAIFAIFYFILIRPGQRERKAQEAMIKQVKRGDEVVTAGGIVGEVIHIKEATAEKSDTRIPNEDRLTIRNLPTVQFVKLHRPAAGWAIPTSSCG